MLPEILGVSVPAELLAHAPSTYSGFSVHAETIRQKKQREERRTGDGKTRSFGHGQHGVETSEVPVDAVEMSTEVTTIAEDADNTL